MRKRFLNLSKLTIQKKLTFLVLIFIVLPFSIFGLIWYEKSTTVLEENAIVFSGEIVDNVNMRIDLYFADIDRLTLTLVGNPLIQKFVETDPADPYEKFAIHTQIQKDIYPSIIYGRTDIFGFSLISRKGLIYSGTSISREQNSEDYKTLFQKELNRGILGIRYLGSIPVITVYRKVLLGDAIIILDLSMDQLLKDTEKIKLAGNGSISIIDTEGNFLYHPDYSKWGQKIPEDYLKGFRLESSHFVEKIKNKIIIFQRSEKTGLTMVSEISQQAIIGKLQQLRNLTLWICLILLAVGVGVLLVFTFSLTDRLENLRRLMRRAEGGDLNINAPDNRRDEIGDLYRGFNTMVGEIKRLVDVAHFAQLKEKEMVIKQRESHLEAMQARINPHFLYNTLEIINSYALEKGVRPISRMAVALAKIFRYSISGSEQVVTLDKELQHVETYLTIQKERYKDLDIVFELEEQLRQQVKALRLTIQPIIENAIIHGYEDHRLKPQYISITAEVREQDCTLTISDKGGGIEKRLVELYNDAFCNVTENQMVTDDLRQLESIGLWNVHHRIRLTFGSPYGLFISRSDESGTDITMKLPYFNGEER